jgi:hypothetical protein
MGLRPGSLPGSRSAILCPTSGKYIENHGVVHNMFYSTTTKVMLPYYYHTGIQKRWDSGSVPIWITAQRQVMQPLPQGQRGWGQRDVGTWSHEAMITQDPRWAHAHPAVPGFLIP